MSACSYDSEGNQTGSSAGLAMAYNAKNQTSSTTPPGASAIAQTYTGAMQFQRVTAASTTFAYNALGLSIQKDASGTTYFTRDNHGALIGERTPGGKYYYLFDGLGSVVGLTDSSGNLANTYTYEPYGKLSSSTGSAPNPWLFTGQYFDAATGFYKIGQRFYDPSLGRWSQQDSFYHLGDTQQVNRYGYARDDPVNLVDPAGLDVTALDYASSAINGAIYGAASVAPAAVPLLFVPEVGPPAAAVMVAQGAIVGAAVGVAAAGLGNPLP